jgi:hypothetical protein
MKLSKMRRDALMKNVDVVKAFLKGQYARTANLYTFKNKLINYDTVIAEYKDGCLIVNTTKYSVSTSKIQNVLLRHLKESEQDFITVNGLRMGIYNLV